MILTRIVKNATRYSDKLLIDDLEVYPNLRANVMTATIINQVFLGELLVRKKLIDRRQLRECLALQRQTRQMLGEIILDKGLVSARQLSILLQEQQWRNLGYWVIGD